MSETVDIRFHEVSPRKDQTLAMILCIVVLVTLSLLFWAVGGAGFTIFFVIGSCVLAVFLTWRTRRLERERCLRLHADLTGLTLFQVAGARKIDWRDIDTILRRYPRRKPTGTENWRLEMQLGVDETGKSDETIVLHALSMIDPPYHLADRLVRIRDAALQEHVWG